MSGKSAEVTSLSQDIRLAKTALLATPAANQTNRGNTAIYSSNRHFSQVSFTDKHLNVAETRVVSNHMYYATSSGGRYDGRHDEQYWIQQSSNKQQATEKRQQYQQNKTMFPNVSTHRRRSGHAQLQQSLSAEGYLEPTISGVGDPNDNRLSVQSNNPSAWHNADGHNHSQKSYFHNPLLSIRSVSAEHDDLQNQYTAHLSMADRHSYHGSSRAITKEASPEPRRRSPSPYSAHPPPVPIRTSPSILTASHLERTSPNVQSDRTSPNLHKDRTSPNVHTDRTSPNFYKEQQREENTRENIDKNRRDSSGHSSERGKHEICTLRVETHKMQQEVSHDFGERQTDAEVNMSAPTRIVLLACGSFNPITNMHLRMFELARDALHRTGRFRVVGGIISPVSDNYSKKGSFQDLGQLRQCPARFHKSGTFDQHVAPTYEDLESAKNRCAMLRLALKSSDWIKLDTWECEQESWLQSVKVLRHHKEVLDTTFNANSDAPSKKRKLDSNLSQDSDYSTCTSHNNLNDTPIEVKLLCGADLLESFGVPDLWSPLDMEEIVGKFGIVCISRSGSNPEQFIYDSDVLTKHQNNIFIVTEWITNDISSTKIRRALRRGESVKYLIQDSVLDYINHHKLYGAGDNKVLNYITPSPNNEDYDHFNGYHSTSRHSPASHLHYNHSAQYVTNEYINNNEYRHDNRYVTSAVTNTPKDRVHGFRRHRGEMNYDEEFRRKDFQNRRSESLDRKPIVRSSTFDKNVDFNKRVSSSFDSLDSPPRTRRPPPTLSAASSTTEMTGLVRRVHGMKIVSVTPETSV